MLSARHLIGLLAWVSLCLHCTARAQQPAPPQYTTFAVGADSVYNVVINGKGTIAGSYQWLPSHARYRGFVRANDGTITEFRVRRGKNTQVTAINNRDAIAGFYVDAKNRMVHGFVRHANGEIGSFDVPEGGIGRRHETIPRSINSAGTVTGYYSDASSDFNGFVRGSDGSIVAFNVAGSIRTGPESINDAGAIAGWEQDASGILHGFLRAPDGSVTTFDAPGTGTVPGRSTYPAAIDGAGVIVGSYTDANTVSHGFLRAVDGTITTFDDTRAGSKYGEGTQASAVNERGEIVGTYSNGVDAGSFLRRPDGALKAIRVPGAAISTVYSGAINGAGAVVGICWDAGSRPQGFLLVP